MNEPLSGRPEISAATAQQWTAEYFYVIGKPHVLPSERDQNFLIQSASDPTSAWVLKIANAFATEESLDFQNRLIFHLGKSLKTSVPQLINSVSGEPIVWIEISGRRHAMRLLSYLPGTPWAHIRYHSKQLGQSLGRFVGRLLTSLQTFPNPPEVRSFEWDLASCAQTVAQRLDSITDPDQQQWVRHFLHHYQSNILDIHGRLRRSTIHNDANDYNVLVNGCDRPATDVTGMIDFGDAVYSQCVNEVAIAVAYGMLGQADPLDMAQQIVGGCHQVFPLTDEEIHCIFSLAAMRLCTSVVISAERQRTHPHDTYLSVSAKPAWDCLRRLQQVSPNFAHFALRSACGKPAHPAEARIMKWMSDHRASFVPVMKLPGDPATLDLSVESQQFALDELADTDDQPMNSRLIQKYMQQQQRSWAIGRYGEARRCYSAPQYTSDLPFENRWRTIHLGIDLFADAGSPVFAPYPGTVVGVADNDAAGDYGPTVILKHVANIDTQPIEFYSLYGHLDRQTLTRWQTNDQIQAGDHIGSLGTESENGGWPPHLHVQLILDLLGETTNFPGVAAPGQRHTWKSICPNPSAFLGLAENTLDAAEALDWSTSALQLERTKRLASSLSVSYDRPLHIVRGSGAYLFDADGRNYLDCVNNVCHVGHSHPRIVQAAASQMMTLNTNTRYLHPNILEYSRRLLVTLPRPLEVCFFVNSGTEANDLALRLARTFTGRHDVMVIDHAYHGHSQSLIDISPYKFNGPGGAGCPDSTLVVPMPDAYRGLYRAPQFVPQEQTQRYAAHVAAALKETKPAAFIAESLLSCGGQIELPPGYLTTAFDRVRAAGGVCIADEVQVGFGRLGSHFWGFESQGVTPDIVTMGKPIGNGHPLAAVVTTRAIADAFNNGMEYFNTFGGNPVSCAVGLAVLDVLQQDQLQSRADKLGRQLLDQLRVLQERHASIGDVRGRGLFLGIEFVSNRKDRTPDAQTAHYVVQRMKNHGILLSTDGPDHNVIKFKPPMVFSASDADRLVNTLDHLLASEVS